MLDFDVAKFYGTGSNYSGVPFATGDFNGDGRVDIAYPLRSQNKVAILLADADGAYLPAVEYDATNAYEVAAGDVDGDGKLDLVVTSLNVNGTKLLRGNGDGTFAAAVSVPGSALHSPVLFDLDGDGKLDLLGGVSGVSWIAFAKGDGTGAFTVGTSIEMNLESRRLVLADINGDSKPDIVSLNANTLNEPVVSARLGQGGGVFGAAQKLTIPAMNGIALGDARDLAVGDFNGDGRADIVVVDDEGVTLLTGSQSGALSVAARFTASFTRTCSGAVTGDWNQDGKTDLAVVSDYDARLTIFPGNGDGTFAAPVLHSSGDRCGKIAAGDVDGDGKPDLLLSSASVGVALARADGSFRAAPILVFNDDKPAGVAAADLDGDGKVDVAVAGSSTQSIAIFKGAGSHAFSTPVTIPAGANPLQIALAPMNGDAHLDLVYGTANGKIGVLLGNGSGGFGAPTLFDNGGGEIEIGDFNGDGRPDVATYTTTSVRVLLNDGNGGLIPAISTPAGSSVYGIATGDLNGDGKHDIVASGYASKDATVLLGDGDGNFHPGAGVTFDGAALHAEIADFTGDGKPDVLFAVNATESLQLLVNGGSGLTSLGLLSSARTFVVPDLTTDGKLDLFYTVGDGIPRATTGQGNGTFDPPRSYVSLWTTRLESHDVDGDGRPDVLVTASPTLQRGYISVFFNASH
ncbi:Putative aggregation factor core protein MAFp3, isoform C [Minicystis rosea]|nr:Putative aggregation factor core protein MAFp3, isoform C [Minicystis rosea]